MTTYCKNKKHMEYITSKERAKVIRKVFVSTFGKENVSVKKGTGTASCWVTSKIITSRPENCTCNWCDIYSNGEKAKNPYRKNGYCEACKNKYKMIDELASKTQHDAMKKAGFEHSTYYVDDGYNSESSEYLQQVEVL